MPRVRITDTDRHNYTRGRCAYLAVKIRELTGARLGVVRRGRSQCLRFDWTHAFVLLEDGSTLDIEGTMTFEGQRQQYGWRSQVEELEGEELEAFLEWHPYESALQDNPDRTEKLARLLISQYRLDRKQEEQLAA